MGAQPNCWLNSWSHCAPVVRLNVQQWIAMLLLLATSWWICTASLGLVCCGCMNQRGLRYDREEQRQDTRQVSTAQCIRQPGVRNVC
jgi:hypothetical protein